MRKLLLYILPMLLLIGCKEDTPTVQTRGTGAERLEQQLARTPSIPTQGSSEVAMVVKGPMPTGIAVSRDGRIFINFPRWGDPVEFTVAEVKNDKAVPYPDLATNKLDLSRADSTLVSVQSVVVDAQNRLWILDTGSINFQPVFEGGPKLLCYDLESNKEVKRITFPSDVCLAGTYLNDVRFALSKDGGGHAFITDSSDSGANGIIVVDLASGKSWRKLNDHSSTKADENFVPNVEGEPLMSRPANGPPGYMKIGSDGIAISPDHKTLYYCPLASRQLHSVSVDALIDRDMADDKVAATVKDLGPRDFASDGLECDEAGNLYLTDYEHNAIHRRSPSGQLSILAQDPRMIWPDSMAIGGDGYLYFTANQLNRQPRFHQEKDLRQQPYPVFRTKIGGSPIAAR